MRKLKNGLVFGSFVLAIGLLIPASAQAQGVGGGLVGGVVTSQIDGDTWGGFNKWGYMVGGFAYYDFNEHLALQIEILQSRRGSREVQTDFGQVTLSYIDVPVLFQYKRELSKGRTAIAEGGLSANLLLAAKTGFRPLILDQTENFARLSSELHLGATVYFTENLGIYGRWQLGITNLNNSFTRRPWLTIHCLSAGVRLRFQ